MYPHENVAAGGRYWMLVDELRAIDMRLRYARWTSVDVLGRPRMAPGAGFEIHRKYVVQKAVDSRKHADTPSNTPIPSATGHCCVGSVVGPRVAGEVRSDVRLVPASR